MANTADSGFCYYGSAYDCTVGLFSVTIVSSFDHVLASGLSWPHSLAILSPINTQKLNMCPK